MENVVQLEFKRNITKLAGYSLGKEIYDSQVKGRVDFEKTIRIEFPDDIRDIASSFIQGFFYEFIEKIGIKGIQERVEIVSSKTDMKEEIINNLI